MSIKKLLHTIDQLHSKIESYGKFDENVLKKINYKFRLDWNYYSNAMEGNSLTKAETRSVMVDAILLEGKSFKDVQEMRGHDDVITDILKIGKGELRLSEKRIKAIHKSIIYENRQEFIDQIGEWKKSNNHLINYKGEKFDFVDHSLVKDEMHHLLDWLNAEVDKIKQNRDKSKHPVLVASEFHVKYISIHPFYDGNGRTARILSNLILISFGYPPVIIKKEEKENVYYKSLADIQGYGGNYEIFNSFFAQKVIESQQMVLDAIEGKEIDDTDDLDKKLQLFEKEFEIIDGEKELKWDLSFETVRKMYENWIREFIAEMIPVAQKFNKYYTDINHYLSFGIIYNEGPFSEKSVSEILNELDSVFSRGVSPEFQLQTFEFRAHFQYGPFKKGGIDSFSCNYSVNIKFDKTKYSYRQDHFSEESSNPKTRELTRLLHQPITEKEIKKFVSEMGDTLLKHMEYNVKKIK